LGDKNREPQEATHATEPLGAEATEEPRGWNIVSFEWLKSPPDWLAAAVYVFATLLVFYVVYMVALGLYAFFRLGHEIASAPLLLGNPSGAAPKSEGTPSLTVFFTVLAALVGGPLAIWRVITAHVQAQAAHRQAAIAREAHYTDLFTKAIEQLGATRDVTRYAEASTEGDGASPVQLVTETEPNLEVRLGAIYALDRIARDSERDHWPIMQVLCAYVRSPQNCGEPMQPPDTTEVRDLAWLDAVKELRVDVQAALTVIGQRPPPRIAHEVKQGFRLNLAAANLQRASLDRAHLEVAILDGAHLERASLARAHLEDATLSHAHLERAFLERAHLERTLLYGANLERASLRRAHLEDAALYGACLKSAFLLDTNLQGATLMSANLEGANLGKAHLGGSILFNTDLSKVRDFDPDELAAALADASTTLPDGTPWPASWPNRVLTDDEQLSWIEKVGRKK
jgi:hypothetical protein